METVLTAAPFEEEGFAVGAEGAEDLLTEEVDVVLVFMSSGLWPVACWMSLPCSLIRAGPRALSLVRSLGVSRVRMSSLTGRLLLDSELMSISNYKEKVSGQLVARV